MYKIDKDIPIMDSKAGSKGPPTKYPFQKMDIGDSIFVEKPKFIYHHTWGKSNNVKFSSRKVTENGIIGIRIWRVK